MLSVYSKKISKTHFQEKLSEIIPQHGKIEKKNIRKERFNPLYWWFLFCFVGVEIYSLY